MADRAKQHLSALILNMVSNKIGQYTVVTDDGRDVGDVVQYVSELIIDGDDTNDELAKDLAESVNNQQTIATGIVPEGTIVFKQGLLSGEVLTYKLFDNYPNPFNPATTIKYQIPNAGFVTLNVYDVLGNEVATLVNERKEEGRYEITFDASTLSSGVYIYQLRVNEFVDTKKMILMK
ncbi:MAG: T9SS type A sorting domain-containing protein [Bacteroidetes bacterium]|nr:T9SS type A sorting domain-containing protein [Bacteroidota bacterium]